MQVAILLGFRRPNQDIAGATSPTGLGAVSHNVSELQSQVTAMQELIQKFSQALLQKGILV